MLDDTICVDYHVRHCALYDTAAGDWAVDVPPMTEQAFVFDRYYDRYHEFEGQTVDVDFTQQVPLGTPEHVWSAPEVFRKMNAYGDASGWTGTAVLSAAARYSATGTAADYERMLAKLEGMMFLYEVTDIPGMIARSHWGMLPEGAPDPVGHWGEALGHSYPDDGTGWHYHYPIPEALLDRLPDYYTDGVEIGGVHYPTEPRWQGDASRDMYVRSMPGVLMAYDLLADGAREDTVRGVIQSELPCTLNRLKKGRLSNLQEAPELKEALAQYLAGGVLTLDEDDIDLTALDTIVVYVMEQPNPAHLDLFDPSCPAGPPLEVDPELDLDAAQPDFLFKVLEFLSRLDRSSERPIVWPMVVSVRASDLLYMTQWALVAHYLTGDPAYLEFLETLMEETEYWGVLNTWGAFQLPKWCQSHYAPSLSYPSLYNLLARVDQADPFWTALSQVAADEVRAKDMGPRDDSYFGVLYSQMVSPETDPTGPDYVADMVAVLEGYGVDPTDKREPDRNYSRNWVDPPHPDVELEELDEASEAICETPIEILGVELDGAGLHDSNPRAVDALPLWMRVGGGFLWTADPWRVLKDYGAYEAWEQFPMLGMTTPYWVGRAHGVIAEGEGLALAWQQTSGQSCGGGGELPDTLVLDPDSLIFFGLPIGSLRMAVSGHDPDARVCASIIWDYSNHGEYLGAHCDDFYQGFPYVVLETDTDGPCGGWDYGTDLTTVAASGCVDFAGITPTGVDLVDVEVEVASDLFTGTILASNRATLDPPAVTFGIEASTDIPESLWVQSGDDLGLPAWVTVTRDDAPVGLFDRCDIPICGEGGGACGQALPQVMDITGVDYSGEVYLTWDGYERVLDDSGDCLNRVPAPPGDYKAAFCLGWSHEDGVVKFPYCGEMPFTLPGADKVVWWAGVGG